MKLASATHPTIAHRSANAPASPIRRLIPHADAAKARGIHVFHLNIGQPDIETPPEMMNVLKELDIKVVPYGPSLGLTEYRRALIGYYRRATGVELGRGGLVGTRAGGAAGCRGRGGGGAATGAPPASSWRSRRSWSRSPGARR